ncbi:hypothetical protein GQX74_009852 [Glossina fuscipes]|nr:hypothetical protein GQX74_009852 [Glossina fuscipes]
MFRSLAVSFMSKKMDKNLNEESKDAMEMESRKDIEKEATREPDDESDDDEEEGRFRIVPNATTISHDHPHLFPKVYKFYFNLVKDIEIEINRVGPSFSYHPSVYLYQAHSCHSLYLNYFVRKHLATKHDVELMDRRTEVVIEEPDRFETGTNPRLKAAIEKHYKIFTDRNTKAIDVHYSVKVVSLSHSIFFHYEIPKGEFHAYYDNLLAIVKYLDSLVYNTVEINPCTGCEYFNGDANIIFDGEVVFQIKTSRHFSLVPGDPFIRKERFSQLALYSFGYYKRTGKKILKLVVYNPLLGCEYVMQLNDIDYELFEKALDRDVTVFQLLFGMSSESDSDDSDDTKKSEEKEIK